MQSVKVQLERLFCRPYFMFRYITFYISLQGKALIKSYWFVINNNYQFNSKCRVRVQEFDGSYFSWSIKECLQGNVASHFFFYRFLFEICVKSPTGIPPFLLDCHLGP
jgi:hypothetical protein